MKQCERMGQLLAPEVQSIDGAGRRRTCAMSASGTGSNPIASQKRGAAAGDRVCDHGAGQASGRERVRS